jgi:hypothetical protein
MGRSRLVVVLTAVAAISAGCGGGGDSSSSKAGTSEGPPPANLVGTYKTTLKSGDLPPDPSPVVADGGPGWTLAIATNGGPDGGPALTITSSHESGALTSAKLGVSGKTLFLHNEECENKAGTNTTFVESEYRWSLSGKTLRLTNVKNGCPDKADLTILTAEPYTKQG